MKQEVLDEIIEQKAGEAIWGWITTISDIFTNSQRKLMLYKLLKIHACTYAKTKNLSSI